MTADYISTPYATAIDLGVDPNKSTPLGCSVLGVHDLGKRSQVRGVGLPSRNDCCRPITAPRMVQCFRVRRDTISSCHHQSAAASYHDTMTHVWAVQLAACILCVRTYCVCHGLFSLGVTISTTERQFCRIPGSNCCAPIRRRKANQYKSVSRLLQLFRQTVDTDNQYVLHTLLFIIKSYM